MAQGKKSFVFYTEWEELFEALNDEEAGKLIKHVLRYVNDKNPQAPDRLTDISFIPIKQTLKRDLKKYEEKAEAARLNGLKGGRPKKVTKPKETQKTQPFFKEPKKAVNVNVNVNDNDILSKERELVDDANTNDAISFNLDFTKDKFKTEQANKAWVDWLEYRYQEGEPVNRKRQPYVKKELAKLATINGQLNETVLIEIVKKCIAMGWKNLQLTDEMEAKLKKWQAA